MPDKSKNPRRVLLVVTDGLGFDPSISHSLVRSIRECLNRATINKVTDIAAQHANNKTDPELIAKLSLMPITAEGITSNNTDWRTAQQIIKQVEEVRKHLINEDLYNNIAALRKEIANLHRYVPWVAENQEWSHIVNNNLTVPTHASGIYAGYEDVDPAVQGNSETGHQQIGNLALAPQIPLVITQSINDGSFFENNELKHTIETTLNNGGNVNFRFLLSGIDGTDGRVHSAWNHLEALCKLIFHNFKFPTNRVRIQAILDGRDAPAHGSLTLPNFTKGFLGELEKLLTRYNAVESLAWVIGRSIAMDRDYQEENARLDYMLLTAGNGEKATGFDDVRAIVANTHKQNLTDADIPPIALQHSANKPASIQPGDAFINLNFRSDRQRAVTASLSAAKDYLKREASARGRKWSLEWIRNDMNLRICNITEYDAIFQSKYGVKVAYPMQPHRLNFLNQWHNLMPTGSRYMLVAESVKASHMGYFIRGRRETTESTNYEDRHIIPSNAQEQGVASDSDFYLHPQMQTNEIADYVAEAMKQRKHALIICNLAAPDMIGHLLPTRYKAAIQAYTTTISALTRLSRYATENQYSMIVTSDHGNIENNAPTHTNNPVLTTVIPAHGTASPHRLDQPYTAALFDISHTVAKLLRIDDSKLNAIISKHRANLPDNLIGKPITK